MNKVNKKGFTIVELIVSFVLVMIVIIYLLKTVVVAVNKNNDLLTIQDLSVYEKTFLSDLYKDIDAVYYSDSFEGMSANGNTITLIDVSNKQLILDKDHNQITYGDKIYKLPEGISFREVEGKVYNLTSKEDNIPYQVLTIYLKVDSTNEDKDMKILYQNMKMEEEISEEEDVIVTFDSNGGDKPRRQWIIYKKDQLLSSKTIKTPKLEHYKIVGWNTNQDGSGENVNLSTTNAKDGDTYYAKWESTLKKFTYDLNEGNNFNKWYKTYAERFTINYDSSNRMNNVSVAGTSGWENLYIPFNTISGKAYKIKFDYKTLNNYTTLSGYDGIGAQVLYDTPTNTNNIGLSLNTVYLSKTANSNIQTVEIQFTADSSKSYLNFNFGMASDGITTNVQLGNIQLIEQVEIGDIISSTPDPSFYGYTHDGWYDSRTNGTKVNTPIIVDENHLTVYERSNPNNYTVAYSGACLSGGTIKGSTATSSHTYDLEQNLNNNGYQRYFEVEYDANGGYVPTSQIAWSTFKNWSQGTNTYNNRQSVKNLATSGSVSLCGNWNNTSITLPNSSKSGYTFDGWYTQASGGTKVGNAGATYTPTSNVTLYAHWTPNIYEVELDNQSATTSGTTKVWYIYNTVKNGCYYYTNSAATTCLSNATITKPTKTGNDFTGYYVYTGGAGTQYINSSGQFINDLYESVGNKKLYANWNVQTKKITFSLYSSGGKTPNNKTTNWFVWNHPKNSTCENGNTYHRGLDAMWTASNCISNGLEAGSITYNDNISNDVELCMYAANSTPVKSKKTCIMELDYGGRPITFPKPADSGSRYFGTMASLRAGYKWGGWYDKPDCGGNRVYSHSYTNGITENTTLYACFVEGTTDENNDKHSYTITYDSNGGSSVAKATNCKGDATTAVQCKIANAPTKANYDFYKWYNTTTKVYKNPGESVKLSRDVTYKAIWTPKVYKITLNANNNAKDADGTKEIYDKYATAWYLDNPTKNKITKITIPKKKGYTFTGYYTSSSVKIIDNNGSILTTTKVSNEDTNVLEYFSGNATLTAHWTPNTYTVTYKSDCGSADWSENISFGSNYTTLANWYICPGYTFYGWWGSDGTWWTPSSVWNWQYDQDVVLTAQWTKDTVCKNEEYRYYRSSTADSCSKKVDNDLCGSGVYNNNSNICCEYTGTRQVCY